MILILLISMLSVTSCTGSVSYWSHPKKSVWRMTYSVLQQKIYWNHIMNAVQICFHPTASGEVSQHLSKEAGDIILCEMATPKLGSPFTKHAEVYWSWIEFVAAHSHFFHFRFHWKNLPKARFTDFVKSQVPSARHGCWELHTAEQKWTRPYHPRGDSWGGGCRAIGNTWATLICSSWRSSLES